MGLRKLLFALLVCSFSLSAQAGKAKKVPKIDCDKTPQRIECRPVLRLDARRPDGPMRTNWKKNLRHWEDLSPTGLMGHLEGGFSAASNPWIKQKKGRPASLSFNGIDQYVNLGTAPELYMSNAFAIELWFKPVLAPGEMIDSQILVNKEGAYEIALFSVSPNDNRVWFALANLEPGWTFSTAVAPIEINKWHHLVWTYDMDAAGDNLFVYHNGNVVYQAHGSGTIDRANPPTDPSYDDFRIGGRQLPGSTEFFEGEISIVKAYRRLLSEKEITRHCVRHAKRFAIACGH